MGKPSDTLPTIRTCKVRVGNWKVSDEMELRREIHDLANLLQVMEPAHADPKNEASDSGSVERS